MSSDKTDHFDFFRIFGASNQTVRPQPLFSSRIEDVPSSLSADAQFRPDHFESVHTIGSMRVIPLSELRREILGRPKRI
jgi:hypothetical protein